MIGRPAAVSGDIARPASPEQALVLGLLRGMAERSPDRLGEVRSLAASADPGRALGLLETQGLLTRLGGLLLDAEIDLSSELADRLRGAQNRARHLGLLNHALAMEVARSLEDRGIAVVPLKGATLADTVYGDIGARDSADVDLLVAAGDLDGAVSVVTEEGWTEPGWAAARAELPRLHRVLFHPARPPIELHWRVHWYESAFAEAALARAQPTKEGWRRMTQADELACLLLFLARDGFAGLRQAVDVAAWWAARGQDGDAAAGTAALAGEHPELAPALGAAAEYAERLAGIPPGSLLAPRKLTRPRRAALRLANPWFEGSREQIAAEVTLVDGLLSPRGGLRAFGRRQILPPDEMLIYRRPVLAGASRTRMAATRALHAVRVLGRYPLACRRLIARYLR